jgi:low affinity Fe/Cu permease
MSDTLPKVSIAVIGVVVVQIAGAIFWGANILRDISDNSEKIDILLEVLVETEDDLMLVDEKLQEDLDENTIKLVNEYYTRMIQMEGRINSMERTVDYLLNSSRHDNGR